MKAPRIVVIGMGGTIGMVRGPEGALHPAASVEELLAQVPAAAKYATLELVPLASLDSTNVTPEHWQTLIETIAQVQPHCEGVLVLHGTDTMAYTATAVSLAFPKASHLPIVFTGSQLPLLSDNTDAARNLISALLTLRLAIRRQLSEVLIVFGDKVLRGNRAIKTSEILFPAFDSPAFAPLAEVTAAGIRLNGRYTLRAAPLAPPDSRFDSRILTVDLTPGLPPALLRAALESESCKGMLLRSLGTGNLPNQGEFSLIPVIHEATARGVPVLVSTKFVGGFTRMGLYAPGKEALEAGAIPTGDMTDVAAQVKLMAALGRGLDVRHWFQSDIAGELTASEDLEEEVF